jgi:hypothetical protein
MSYERLGGLGDTMMHTGGSLLAPGSTPGTATTTTTTPLLRVPLTTMRAVEQLPPLIPGYERIPREERTPFSVWFLNKFGMDAMRRHAARYPNWSAASRSTIAQYRRSKARVRALLQDGGAQVARGMLTQKRLDCMEWWKRCDGQGGPAAWDSRIFPEIPPDSAPKKIIDHFGTYGFRPDLACPSGAYRTDLFKWNVGDPGWPAKTPVHRIAPMPSFLPITSTVQPPIEQEEEAVVEDAVTEAFDAAAEVEQEVETGVPADMAPPPTEDMAPPPEDVEIEHAGILPFTLPWWGWVGVVGGVVGLSAFGYWYVKKRHPERLEEWSP